MIVSVDPKADANRFLSLLRSNLHERGLLGIAESLSGAEVEREMAACVQMFMRGVEVPAAER